jgi:hypothetical protein
MFMTIRFSAAVAAVAAAILLAAPAGAVSVVAVNSDADWLALTGATGASPFTKVGGVTVRAGNRATSGDWEAAVVNAADAPIVQGQQAWAPTNVLTPTGSLGFATYMADGTTTLAYTLAGPVSLTAGLGAGANSIWVRARTDGSDATTAAVLSGLSLTLFDTGEVFSLGTLTGDGDANYLGVVSNRLTGGFSLGFGSAQFDPRMSNGSNVLLQVKIGNSPAGAIPEPATWAMLIAGFGLVGGAMRRRRTPAAA